MRELTQEEKIDYIYENLIKNEKKIFWGNIVKWSFRLIIVLYLLYLYYILIPGMFQKLKEKLTPRLPEINTSEIREKVKSLFN